MSDRSNPVAEPLVCNSTPTSLAVPIGFCQCGCGLHTRIITRTINSRGYRKGDHQKYIFGHHPSNHPCRTPAQITSYMESTPNPNPSGLCMCGCVQFTAVAKSNNPEDGHVKGCSKRYLKGHHQRSSPVQYLVQDCGYATPCWVWQWATNRGGYPAWTGSEIEGEQLAHRIFYIRVKGSIPVGHILDHLCRVRKCVNPDHLEAVTHSTNVHRGLSCKLNPEDARAIFLLRQSGMKYEDIGDIFGISQEKASMIARGKIWREATEALRQELGLG